MALAGLPEDLAIQVREARPRKVLDKERRRRLEELGQRNRPTAEGLVSGRAAACDVLLHALEAASKVLAGAGRELKRVAGTSRNDPDFKRALHHGEPPIAVTGLGMLEAVAGLGAALAGLSAAMAGQTAETLQEVRHIIGTESAKGLADMMRLEKQEDACAEAVKEGLAHKERLAAELQESLKDREAYENGGGLSGWLRKPSSASIDRAAHQQRAAVEELAVRMDRAAVARQNRKKGIDAFRAVLQKVDSRCKSQLQHVVGHCVSAWNNAARTFEDAAKQLRIEKAGGFSGRFLTGEFADDTSNFGDRIGFIGDGELGGLNSGEVCLMEDDGERSISGYSDFTVTTEVRGSRLRPIEDDECSETPAPPLIICFGEEVKRLGFEILWEAECPSVLKVMAGGEAERVGISRGDVLKEINGTCTLGKGRDDLMPLLKLRPLRLVLAHVG